MAHLTTYTKYEIWSTGINIMTLFVGKTMKFDQLFGYLGKLKELVSIKKSQMQTHSKL